MTAITNSVSLTGNMGQSGFKPVPLKRLVSKIGSGKTPVGGNEAYLEHGVPFIRSQNVYFDGLRLDNIVFIDEATHSEMSSTAVQPHDVLLNITGASIGRATLVPKDLSEANVNQHVCICRPRRKAVEARYLCYTLQSAPAQSEIWGTQIGASREGLNFEEVGALPVFIPSGGIGAQKAIASFLDRKTAAIDELIGKKERLIELLEEKRATLINRAVTKGLNPDVPMKDSGVSWIGEIPEHWQIRRTRYICRITTGDGDTQDAIEDGSYPFFVRSDTVESSNNWTFDGEAVLTSGDGAGVGKIFHYYVGKMAIHQRVYLFHSFRSVRARYFYYFLKANFMKVVKGGTAKSTVDSLRLPMLQDFPVVFPTTQQQDDILIYLDKINQTVNRLLENTQTQIAKLQEYRQSLITAAVTGQIDVTEESDDLTEEEIEGALA